MAAKPKRAARPAIDEIVRLARRIKRIEATRCWSGGAATRCEAERERIAELCDSHAEDIVRWLAIELHGVAMSPEKLDANVAQLRNATTDQRAALVLNTLESGTAKAKERSALAGPTTQPAAVFAGTVVAARTIERRDLVVLPDATVIDGARLAKVVDYAPLAGALTVEHRRGFWGVALTWSTTIGATRGRRDGSTASRGKIVLWGQPAVTYGNAERAVIDACAETMAHLRDVESAKAA